MWYYISISNYFHIYFYNISTFYSFHFYYEKNIFRAERKQRYV